MAASRSEVLLTAPHDASIAFRLLRADEKSTFAELCKRDGVTFQHAGGYYEVGTKSEQISEDKELVLVKGLERDCSERVSIVSAEKDEVRKKLQLGDGKLSVSRKKVHAATGDESSALFVQSTSATRQLAPKTYALIQTASASASTTTKKRSNSKSKTVDEQDEEPSNDSKKTQARPAKRVKASKALEIFLRTSDEKKDPGWVFHGEEGDRDYVILTREFNKHKKDSNLFTARVHYTAGDAVDCELFTAIYTHKAKAKAKAKATVAIVALKLVAIFGYVPDDQETVCVSLEGNLDDITQLLEDLDPLQDDAFEALGIREKMFHRTKAEEDVVRIEWKENELIQLDLSGFRRLEFPRDDDDGDGSDE